ncbi:MAG: type II and III secretion system protein [Nitrospinae bacterium]|nr:type II and III secretion system protein [Nitrospinota bacterium]
MYNSISGFLRVLQNKLTKLINGLLLIIQTITIGCAIPKNIPPPKKEVDQFKEKRESLEAKWQSSPLFQEGTKPLIEPQKELFLPEEKNNIPTCKDIETGKENEFLLADLKSELIQLSYSNMDRVVNSLNVMGMETILATAPVAKPYTVDKRGRATYITPPKNVEVPKTTYTCSQLPIFYKPKVIPVNSLSDVLKGPGTAGMRTGSRFSFVDMASVDYGLNESLVAFYHPEKKERFNNIIKTIRETIDAAPVQVYIESMVLEVNESGFDKLGVLYKSIGPQGTNTFSETFEAGATTVLTPSAAAASSSTLLKGIIQKGASVGSIADILSLEIQALVAKGSAEVLSRPSVIALNNRPAIIEVTEQRQYPIRQQSTFNQSTTNFSYSFQEVTPGILLQIRPRVSDENNDVAMEIDVQVKALVSDNDGNAVNDNGDIISTKPGSSTRRVHTFAIVPNKTPIIIGGLVSKDKENNSNKLPFFGDLPFIGNLFGATSASNEKREVIVVITPHIINDNKNIGIQNPKDTAMFDDMNMELFRDSYRIRSEDMFDLGFIYRSKKFQQYRNYVLTRASKDSKFAGTAIARDYNGEQFPGGDALVARMIYDIVGKRNLEKEVSQDKIILTERADDGGFKDVAFLEKAWKEAQSKSITYLKDYGLELKFSEQKAKSKSIEPHVSIRVLPRSEIDLLTEVTKKEIVPDRIFIAKEKDMKKIRKAIVVREILKLNKSKHILGSLNTFKKGTKLVLPVIDKERHFLLDMDVATTYHQIKYYYEILEQSLQESFNLVESIIQKD